MTDSIHWRAAPERAVPVRLVFAVGSEQPGAHALDERLEVAACKALVGQNRAARQREAFEDLCGDLALWGVGRRELKADRHSVGRADQHETKSPEKPGVRAAPAVGRVAGQLGSAGGLARLAAGHRGAVEQPQPVTEGRRFEDHLVEQPDDLRGQRADALVVAGLLGQIGKQMTQPPASEREKPPVAWTVQQHLSDGQADQLSVGDPWRMTPTATRQQDVIGKDVESNEERVEAGGHRASKVDGARTPSAFDTSTSPPRRRPRNPESII
jgi:hypothetical protein